MMRILVIILLISSVLMPATAFAAEDTAQKAEECPPDDRRCITDRRLDFLEETVKDVHKSYKDGTAWKMPEYENKTNTKYGYKALYQLALTPNYAFKAATWPVAILANTLIKHGVVRKVVDTVSSDDRTLWVYPKIEFGFGSGFGGGVGIKDYDLFKSKYELSATYQIHINMNQEAYLALERDDLTYINGKALAFKFENKFIHHNEDNFYGIGIGSSRQSAKYGIDELRSGGWFGYEVLKNLLLRMHTYFIWDDTRPGKGGESVNSRFPESTIPAFGKSLYYFDAGLGLVHDTRDCTAAPEKGGIRRFTFRRYVGLGENEHDYNEFDLDVAQFFNFWRPRHVIVLRTDWIYQQQTDDRIPFYRLARLDINSPLRSYSFGRFRDRARAVFNVEYRFPVWDYLDGQIFFDTGRVFHDWKDFSFKHFKYSAGVGLRLRTKDYFLARFSVAGGPEGVKFVFKTSQAF